MAVIACPVLARCLERYMDTKAAALIRARLAQVDDPAALPALYDQAIPRVEKALWDSALAPAVLADCHALFAEMENHIAMAGNDTRHRLVVVVPVADRPQHLRACLRSLVGAAQDFRYGAGNGQSQTRLAVVIADDSSAARHIAGNRAVADEIGRLGIETTYFGMEEQLAELDALTTEDRQALQNIIGSDTADAFCHKGASIIRNITYLMLARMARQDDRSLFLFVDSDQEFHANTTTGHVAYTTNYFYHIDRIFRQSPVEVLTGKVVGDPPVSPAVMAGTLLEDVLALLAEIAGLEPDAPCTFHQGPTCDDGAAYHDMASLFGYEPSGEVHRYRCPLHGTHNHGQCLSEFAHRLKRFFDGEHPTRVTPYQHMDVQASVTPARTVYTGNYVLSPAGLKYFIPFAGLRLRMAGPVLGRLIQSGSGNAFVSANLPLLHRRTLAEEGSAEFRPGVDRSARLVDLSGEFERQFFGDVMLFAVIDLVEQGYPEKPIGITEISAQVLATETSMRAHYAQTRQCVLTRLGELEVFLSGPEHWWNSGGYQATRALFGHFIASLHANFDDDAPCWQLLEDEAHRESRRTTIVEALAAYRLDRESWERVLQRCPG